MIHHFISISFYDDLALYTVFLIMIYNFIFISFYDDISLYKHQFL